jgi:hypothetical protein
MGAYMNIPRDTYTPRGEPLTPELMALLDEREAANRSGLAEAQRQAEADHQRDLAKAVTTIPTDILKAELARHAKADQLAEVYRPQPLTADELKLINEDTPEYCLPIKAQMLRATVEGDTERLIRLQRQLLSIIQNAQSAAATAALQAKAAEIIASEQD